MIRAGITRDGQICELNPKLDDLIGCIANVEYYYNRLGIVYMRRDNRIDQLTDRAEIVRELAQITEPDEELLRKIIKDLS